MIATISSTSTTKQFKGVRLSLYLMLICFSTAFSIASAEAPYDIVYQLYFELLKSPETGDQLIEKNKHLFDDSFYECVGELMSKYQKWAIDYADFCEYFKPHPKVWGKCISGNEPMKIYEWLSAIVPVTRGEVLWSQTSMGQLIIMSKEFFKKNEEIKEILGYSTYVSLIKAEMPLYRPFFLCE